MRLGFCARTHCAVVVSLLLAGCHSPEPPPAPPRVVAVTAPAPQSGMVGEAYPGSVRARVESPLSFRVGGKIVERRVDIGARVRKNDVLAVLDPVDARLNLQASVAAVGAAEADARLADSEYRRYQDLQQRGFVSRSLLDQRGRERDLAQARLRQAQSESAVVRNQSRYTRLLADADGIVTEIVADAGAVVSAGQPVLGFARDGEREVRIGLPEGPAVDALRAAPAVAITLWALPGRTYEGRVREIGGNADASTRTHEARISFIQADDDVRLGMTASVLVASAPGAAAWRLPLTAVGDRNGKAVVWRVVGDAGQPGAESSANGATTAQPLPVTVLQYLNDAVVVAGDLAAGDRVISAGVQLLRPGMAVKPIDRAAPVAL